MIAATQLHTRHQLHPRTITSNPANTAVESTRCLPAPIGWRQQRFRSLQVKSSNCVRPVSQTYSSCSYNIHNSYGRWRKASSLSCGAAAPRRIVPVMVEGHQCHRVAHAHRRLLLGKAFTATSPNGRFAEGAAAISGKVLSRIEVHGKNLFYFFSGASASTNGEGGNSSSIPGSSNSNHDPNQAAAAALVLSPEDQDPLAEPISNGEEESSPQSPAEAAAAAVQMLKTPQQQQQQLGLLASIGRSVVSSTAAAAAAVANAAVPDRDLTPFAELTAAAGPPAHAATPAAAAVLSSNQDHSSSDSDTTVVHIHFGMSGAFRTSLMPGPEATPTTRLRLEHTQTGMMAHLSAMTVAHGGLDLYQEKVSKLGPDPLRPTDDAERFWARVRTSKKPIGLLLMDQSAVAGVGNIYRAEILYKSRVHPEQPGYTISRETFDVIWGHCVELLHRGFTSGSILTVDPDDARTLGKPWTRRYIYNQRQCGRCKSLITSWDMAGRTVYCCATCQPLHLSIAAASTPAAAAEVTPIPGSSSGSSKSRRRKGGGSSGDAVTAAAAAAAAAAAGTAAVLLSPARLKSMAAARAAKEFVSHCAPDDPSDLHPSKMTCAQLRDSLRALNLDTRGNKPQLVARLQAAQGWMSNTNDIGTTAAGVDSGDGGEEPKQEAAATAADGGTSKVSAAAAAGGVSKVAVPMLESSGSEDELDRAEDRLAENLSVPAAKRRRRMAAAAPPPAAPQTPAVQSQQRSQSRRTSSSSTATRTTSRRRTRTPAAAAAAVEGAEAAAGGIGGMASASAAAAEKAAAGENRAVEHVALHADAATEAMMMLGE